MAYCEHYSNILFISFFCDEVVLYWGFEIRLTLQRGVTGTARMLHALTHSSISRQVREQM